MSIQTYVFFTLKTTGQESNNTRVTELSMVALKRTHIMESYPSMPRIKNKLTMRLKPERVNNIEGSYALPPMSTNEGKFNLIVSDIIHSFLNSQKKPICLIVHDDLFFDSTMQNNRAEDIFYADIILLLKGHSETEASTSIPVESKIESDKAGDSADGKDKELGEAMDEVKQPSKLQEIFNETFDEEEGQGVYGIEDECLMMVKLALNKCMKFIEWIDKTHRVLPEVWTTPIEAK